MIYPTRYSKESGIPASVEYVTYATAFGDHERPYDWSQVVDTIEALAIPCRPKSQAAPSISSGRPLASNCDPSWRTSRSPVQAENSDRFPSSTV
jgi:hypothetical protein